MSGRRYEEAENVIRAAFGTTSFEKDEVHLPVVLGGMSPFRCDRCGRTFGAATFHVEPVDDPVCRYCARDDEQLSIWAEFCDVMDWVDQLMQWAGDRRQRLILAEVVAKYADHFARWRWPEEEPADESVSEP